MNDIVLSKDKVSIRLKFLVLTSWIIIVFSVIGLVLWYLHIINKNLFLCCFGIIFIAWILSAVSVVLLIIDEWKNDRKEKQAKI